MGNIEISVSIPLDESGMVGRECLECEQYFKVKPGTGLDTDHCYCPYCEYEGNDDTFYTKAQIEYVRSVALQKAFDTIVNPELNKLEDAFKRLERETRNTILPMRVEIKRDNYTYPIKEYTEEELETNVICDNCSLEFSIYGVFSHCPDCNKSNAFIVYNKSLEVLQKTLNIYSKNEMPAEVLDSSLSSILSSAIAVFDGLGKELRKLEPSKYPKRPRNLFQNLYELNKSIDDFISLNHSDFKTLHMLFQVRHIFEHNMGVVDKACIEKVPSLSHMLNRKYKLSITQMNEFIAMMYELGEIVKQYHTKV